MVLEIIKPLLILLLAVLLNRTFWLYGPGLYQPLVAMVGNTPLIGYLVSSVVQFLVLAGLSIGVLKAGTPVWPRLGLQSVRVSWVLRTGLTGGLTLFVAVVATGLLINYFYPVTWQSQPLIQAIKNISGPGELLVALLIGVVLAPLGEEIFFRGLLFTRLRDRFGLYIALALSSLLFAVVHFDLARLMPLAVGGFGLAWIYQKTRSLYPAVVAHGVWNGLMIFLLVFIR